LHSRVQERALSMG